ncbi:hypothetical protein TNCT_529631 [Trichonephila clavata]|uniref:Uncharacterized protein n=1 Tax=Trichonephila clavata TaxID=2740835 RepID=A0A8X6L7Q1_TRICU|nr:hypothetical protein TNCT_529631 [Trichonephila clavata]
MFYIVDIKRTSSNKGSSSQTPNCKSFSPKCGKQIEAPLPSERFVPSATFTTTVIDFAGTANSRCLKQRDPAFITIFIFATTRGLHIELLSYITNDKAAPFHAANKELILLWQTLSSAKTQH